MRHLGLLGIAFGLVLSACDAEDVATGGSGGDSGGGWGGGPTTTTSSTGQGGSGEMCSAPMTPCQNHAECCDGYVCGDTSLGHVCCGETGAACATIYGEDCCGALWCVIGSCEDKPPCEGPCKQPPALIVERDRLAVIGGSFLGICGDANHTYGYHVAAANLPSSRSPATVGHRSCVSGNWSASASASGQPSSSTTPS